MDEITPTHITSTAILYMSRKLGERGLESMENEYKNTKIKAALKRYCNADHTMAAVRSFEELAVQNGRHSIIKDAKKYAEEMDLQLWLNFPNPTAVADVEPWFSQVTPKPLYENEHATAFWDVPLFADTTQVNANRIDATVIDKTSKQVRVIEMSCPWLENRESKDFEKTTKYSQLRLELTNQHLDYKVNQYNTIMDVLGGCQKRLSKI
ncbi:unnamed protein product [Porites evermanni]|uniref:Uncharacterized protein n=1 Tax=Porites evermanni TaxID=104178 RepID=A0ABN8N0C5_9CNID|nr:unnamed protein product [Porites evermanni]